MVTFNDLRISLDGKKILIDASVEPYDFYDNMYIESLAIVTDEQYNSSGIITSSVYSKDFSDQPKRISLEISIEDMKDISSLDKNIFYVYITCNGTMNEDPGCGWNNKTDIGVVLNWYPIYKIGINHMKRVTNSCCELDKEFMDYILRLKSFELSLRTGNYVLANENYRKWFVDKVQSSVPVSGCKNC